jgi:hypothetical protein
VCCWLCVCLLVYLVVGTTSPRGVIKTLKSPLWLHSLSCVSAEHRDVPCSGALERAAGHERWFLAVLALLLECAGLRAFLEASLAPGAEDGSGTQLPGAAAAGGGTPQAEGLAAPAAEAAPGPPDDGSAHRLAADPGMFGQTFCTSQAMQAWVPSNSATPWMCLWIPCSV